MAIEKEINDLASLIIKKLDEPALTEMKQLRAQLNRTNDALDKEFNNGITLCAEIERLEKLCATYKQIADSTWEKQAEIERLQNETEQWRKLNSERVDEIAGLIHRLREAATANERLEVRIKELEEKLARPWTMATP